MAVISGGNLLQGRGIFDQRAVVGAGRGCGSGVSGFKAWFR